MKLIKIPLVNALGKKGSEKSPDLVLDKLRDFVNGDFLEVVDVDVDNDDAEKSMSKVKGKAKEEIKKEGDSDEKFVFLGGDHSITYPVLGGLFGKENKKDGKGNNFLIVFDAHADCDFCNKEPTHEEWLRAVVENGVVKAENIVLIGLRKFWKNEKQFLDENNIKYFSCEISDGGVINLEGVGDYVTEKANAEGIEGVYVSVDMDVFEPGVAPSVHYPEFGGLLSRDFFYLFNRILKLPKLRFLDLVEIVPEKDEKYDFRTIELGAEIVRRFIV